MSSKLRKVIDYRDGNEEKHEKQVENNDKRNVKEFRISSSFSNFTKVFYIIET